MNRELTRDKVLTGILMWLSRSYSWHSDRSLFVGGCMFMCVQVCVCACRYACMWRPEVKLCCHPPEATHLGGGDRGLHVQGPPWRHLGTTSSLRCVVNIYGPAWMPSAYLKHQEPSNNGNVYLSQWPKQLALPLTDTSQPCHDSWNILLCDATLQ